MCKNIDMDFIDSSKVINPRERLNNKKLLLNLKGSIKLQDILTGSSKNLFPCWHCKTKSKVLRKGDRVSNQDRKGSVSQNEDISMSFKEVLASLRMENLNRVILAHLNINSIRNKFDLLAEGLNGDVDVIMISETKIDETFPARQFHIDGYIPSIDQIAIVMEVV